MQEGMPKYSRLSATILCTGVLEIGAYHSHKSTYMASYKVDNLIDAGHEVNKKKSMEMYMMKQPTIMK